MKALFIDRDGILNKLVSRDGGWFSPRSLEEFCVSEDAVAVLNDFRNQNFTVFVITNQPDMARRLLQPETLLKFHSFLDEQLGPLEFLVCPHTAEVNCDCRKPRPGLIIEACSRYNIDISASWLIGDQASDIIAGRDAGLKTVLVYSQATLSSLQKFPDSKSDYETLSLADAAHFILTS